MTDGDLLLDARGIRKEFGGLVASEDLSPGGLDPIAATDAFLDAVFARIDPTDLADQLDAIGDRIEARFLALGD